MKKLLSIFSLHKVFTRSFGKGSALWKSWFVALVLFRIIKWLFSKPQSTIVEEYELDPGEYKIVITENDR